GRDRHRSRRAHHHPPEVLCARARNRHRVTPPRLWRERRGGSSALGRWDAASKTSTTKAVRRSCEGGGRRCSRPHDGGASGRTKQASSSYRLTTAAGTALRHRSYNDSVLDASPSWSMILPITSLRRGQA